VSRFLFVCIFLSWRKIPGTGRIIHEKTAASAEEEKSRGDLEEDVGIPFDKGMRCRVIMR